MFKNKLRNFFLNDLCILILIIINAIIIFIEEFDISATALDYVETVFTILFIVELYIKISEYGFKKYISDGWNKLDFILVLISIPSLAILFNGEGVMETNILLSLRVLRVFKSFRLIKFMPEVDSFIASIKRALRASYIILGGFFILLFIVSLISCSIYKNVAPEYFGNPAISIYSIFQIFSVEGWYEIPDLIAERVGTTAAFFTRLYFSFLLLSGGIMGLSLVNSIFVDAMVSDNTDDLETEVEKLNNKIDDLNKKIDSLLTSQKRK